MIDERKAKSGSSEGPMQMMVAQEERQAAIQRATRETNVTLYMNIDTSGTIKVKTGLGFLDHMIETLAFYAGMSLTLTVKGDLGVDDHHTSEDCAIVMGEALRSCMGKKEGLTRFGYAYAPMDEALARSVVDLSGRPYASIDLRLKREMVGQWATENVDHFFRSLSTAAMATVHVDVLRGENDHHKIEGAFKALGLSLKEALRQNGTGELLSVKGVL